MEEVCQHAAYVLLERKARQLDRVRAESSFVVHFYHVLLRRDILAVRRYLWNTLAPPTAIRSASEVVHVRERARLWKNLPSLGIDPARARIVGTSRINRRWKRLLLGDVSLLLAARSALPAGLRGVWHSSSLDRQLGARRIHELQSSEPVSKREAILLEALQEGRAWESRQTASVTLRVFTNAAVVDVLRAYKASRDDITKFARAGERELLSKPGLTFAVSHAFEPTISYLEFVISSEESLPDGRLLQPWFKACLDRYRASLQAGGSYLSDEAVRLWTTSSLVDFAGLSNREAMIVWDRDIAASRDMPTWDVHPNFPTQSGEVSFANARREVFHPRKGFYLQLLDIPRA